MFKVKVSSKFRAQLTQKINKLVTEEFVESIQREVIEGEIKPLISAGVSPVRSTDGGRRFKGYKDPDRYPGTKKAKRPVSLWLTGQMLTFYRAKKVSGRTISMGIDSNAPQEVKDKALANNVGTVNSRGETAIVARRFVPLTGESYNVSVVRKIKNLYARRLKALLSSK